MNSYLRRNGLCLCGVIEIVPENGRELVLITDQRVTPTANDSFELVNSDLRFHVTIQGCRIAVNGWETRCQILAGPPS